MSTDRTDRLSEIISSYVYDDDHVQLIDLDSWNTDDVQEALSILDDEVVERCNRDLG